MHRLQHQVPGAIDQLLLALGMRSPQQEHHVRALLADHLDDSVGEELPAFLGMRSGIGALDRHGRVEQQHPLLGPALQVTMTGDGDIQVALQFFVDVHQRRRRRHPWLHRETQAVGLAGAVIGILAENHHFHLLQRRGVQRIEDHRPRRVDLFAGSVFLAQEFAQLVHVGLVELGAQSSLPTGFEFDAIVVSHGAIRKQWRDTR